MLPKCLLGDNRTLFVGNVFQAEEGEDTPSDTDVRFTKTKSYGLEMVRVAPLQALWKTGKVL